MMSWGVTLSLKLKNKDRLELCLSPRSRIILAFFFVLSCLVLFSGDPSSGKVSINLLPLLLVIVTGLGALYEERWIFDRKRSLFENHFGLIFLSRKRRTSLDELARVELDSFVRGRLDDREDLPEDAGSLKSAPRSEKSSFTSFLGLTPKRHAYRIVKLMVVDTHEKTYVLDTAKGHRLEDFRRTGKRIAEFCGLPFQEK
jgi:hypothetical protein